jgi:hypothetical protein
VGINIGPVGTPEAFARNGSLEHPYAYAENKPANMVDPSGLYSVDSSCRRYESEVRRNTDAICACLDCCVKDNQVRDCLKQLCESITVRCGGWACKVSGIIGACGWSWPPWGGGTTIHLCWIAFTDPSCGPPWHTILHEMTHRCVGRSERKADEIPDACTSAILNRLQPMPPRPR